MNQRFETKGQGLLRGPDGKIQDRKLAAWTSFILGVLLLVQGTFLPLSASIEAKVVPAIVALCFSLLFWGLVTVQNVFQLVALLKGQAADIAKEAGETHTTKELGNER
ncbi:MAG TPA: hypothetical protein VMV83_18225 [Rectinemataceae bacterium]|nr:hypothetical protein [Rectinemataceae bacterium]